MKILLFVFLFFVPFYIGGKEVLYIQDLSHNSVETYISAIKPQSIINTSSENFLDPKNLSSIDFHFLEKDHEIFLSKNRLYKRLQNTHVYEGEQTELLRSLLQKIKGAVLFIFDAEPSVRKKIQMINNKKSSFLITHIQNLSTQEIQRIKQDLLNINKEFIFVVCGDFAIAHSPCETLSHSPLSEAITISQLEEQGFDRILEAEKAIAYTLVQQQEKKTIFDLAQSKNEKPLLWKALSLMGEKNYFEASRCLHKLESEGYNDWRLYWYIAQVEYERRNIFEAERAIKHVLRAAPQFEEAHLLQEKIVEEK